jgi:uncharacterized protein YjiK
LTRRRYWLGALALLVLAGVVSWHIRILPFLWHRAIMLTRADEKASAIWLPDYRMDVDGVKIEGLTENLSGLTYNAVTGTLFTVVNDPPKAAEISTDGQLLRILPITGGQDPEGITHVEDDLFVIADEGTHKLSWVRIGPETTTLELDGAPYLSLELDMQDNLGIEGVSWDARKGQLLVVQEMLPLRVLILSGLREMLDGGPLAIDIREWKASNASTLFMRDLSSLTLHEGTGNILLLSHMSRMIVEYAPDGRPVSVMGLSGVPQAEGVAMGAEGQIFVISEPNLFYRFVRTTPAHWLADTDPASAAP